MKHSEAVVADQEVLSGGLALSSLHFDKDSNAAHQGFGIISTTAIPLRQLQLGIKYSFQVPGSVLGFTRLRAFPKGLVGCVQAKARLLSPLSVDYE